MTSFDNLGPTTKRSQPDFDIKLQPQEKQPTEMQLKEEQLKAVEYAAVGFMLLETSIIAGRTGAWQKMAAELAPVLEKSTTGAWTSALRLAKAAPKTTMLTMEDGVELQLSKDTTFFGRKQDLISVVHPTAGEAHLLRDGGRLISKAGVANLWDEPGIGLHVTFIKQDPKGAPFLLDNHKLTPVNKKAFRTLEDCFLTGSTKTLRGVPNLFEHVARDIGSH